jgi:hypothetical protein
MKLPAFPPASGLLQKKIPALPFLPGLERQWFLFRPLAELAGVIDKARPAHARTKPC